MPGDGERRELPFAPCPPSAAPAGGKCQDGATSLGMGLHPGLGAAPWHCGCWADPGQCGGRGEVQSVVLRSPFFQDSCLSVTCAPVGSELTLLLVKPMVSSLKLGCVCFVLFCFVRVFGFVEDWFVCVFW